MLSLSRTPRESSSHVASIVHPRHAQGRAFVGVQLKIGVTRRRVSLVVFEAVEVLVPFAAHLAAIRLLLLHTDGSGVGNRRDRIHDGEGAVLILLELLILMAVLRTNVSIWVSGKWSIGQHTCL